MPSRLKYTASNIAKAETVTGESFMQALQEMNKKNGRMFSMLRTLYLAGGRTDEELDQALKPDMSNINDLLIEITEGLNDSGFLGKEKIDTAELRKMLKTAAASATSQTSGEASKK